MSCSSESTILERRDTIRQWLRRPLDIIGQARQSLAISEDDYARGLEVDILKEFGSQGSVNHRRRSLTKERVILRHVAFKLLQRIRSSHRTRLNNQERTATEVLKSLRNLDTPVEHDQQKQRAAVTQTGHSPSSRVLAEMQVLDPFFDGAGYPTQENDNSDDDDEVSTHLSPSTEDKTDTVPPPSVDLVISNKGEFLFGSGMSNPNITDQFVPARPKSCFIRRCPFRLSPTCSGTT